MKNTKYKKTRRVLLAIVLISLGLLFLSYKQARAYDFDYSILDFYVYTNNGNNVPTQSLVIEEDDTSVLCSFTFRPYVGTSYFTEDLEMVLNEGLTSEKTMATTTYYHACNNEPYGGSDYVALFYTSDLDAGTYNLDYNFTYDSAWIRGETHCHAIDGDINDVLNVYQFCQTTVYAPGTTANFGSSFFNDNSNYVYTIAQVENPITSFEPNDFLLECGGGNSKRKYYTYTVPEEDGYSFTFNTDVKNYAFGITAFELDISPSISDILTYTGDSVLYSTLNTDTALNFDFNLSANNCNETYYWLTSGSFYLLDSENNLIDNAWLGQADNACSGSGHLIISQVAPIDLDNVKIAFKANAMSEEIITQSDPFNLVFRADYSSVSPMVPDNTIFGFVNSNPSCAVNSSCKINYYYNWNRVPSETNELKVYEVSSANFPLNCWIDEEIIGLSPCPLVGTYSIEDLNMLGKNNGASFLTLSHNTLGFKHYLAIAYGSEFSTNKFFTVNFIGNAPINLNWNNLDPIYDFELNYLFYKIADLNLNNQRTLYFNYNYCGAGQEFDNPIFWIMGGAGEAYGEALDEDDSNSYIPSVCAGYGYFEVDIPIQEGTLYLDLGFFNEVYDGETLISRNLIFKSSDTTIIGIAEDFGDGTSFDSDDWWITRQIKNIFLTLQNIFPFNILSGFLNAWNRSGEIVGLLNPFVVKRAYAQSGDFNLEGALNFPVNGEGFEVIKINDFANTGKTLSLSLFDKSALESFIGSDFLELMRGLLTMGLWISFFLYLFFRIKNFDI